MVYLFLTEGIMNLFGNTWEEQAFLTGLFCVFAAVYFALDFRKRSRYFRNVQKAVEGMEEKYLMTEMVEEPDYLEGRLMYQYDVEILKSMNDEIARHERIGNEFKSYIETWIHEIKIPIASAGLMLHNMYAGGAGKDDLRKVRGQLHRIEEDVEQVLYYIRSEVPEKDYVIGKHLLKTIVQEAVKDQKDSLILHHFSVQVELGEEEVYTDKKWMAFILRQLISNAVKYAGGDTGMLRFFTLSPEEEGSQEGDRNRGQGISLAIEDRGIGIPKGDIARVFEKSFTGQNGRNSASTGMGLYICRRLCRELGHEIRAESEPGKYTRIWIQF